MTARGVLGAARPKSEPSADDHRGGRRLPFGNGPVTRVLPLEHVPPFEREAAVMRAWFTGQSHGRPAG
jgi:hypothetical protein